MYLWYVLACVCCIFVACIRDENVESVSRDGTHAGNFPVTATLSLVVGSSKPLNIAYLKTHKTPLEDLLQCPSGGHPDDLKMGSFKQVATFPETCVYDVSPQSEELPVMIWFSGQFQGSACGILSMTVAELQNFSPGSRGVRKIVSINWENIENISIAPGKQPALDRKVKHIIERLKASEQYIFGGHSVGGFLAHRYAQRYKKDCVLISPWDVQNFPDLNERSASHGLQPQGTNQTRILAFFGKEDSFYHRKEEKSDEYTNVKLLEGGHSILGKGDKNLAHTLNKMCPIAWGISRFVAQASLSNFWDGFDWTKRYEED